MTAALALYVLRAMLLFVTPRGGFLVLWENKIMKTGKSGPKEKPNLYNEPLIASAYISKQITANGPRRKSGRISSD